jgi:hypothetical protein
MFFSEEKNQKTFISAPVPKSGTWPDSKKPAPTSPAKSRIHQLAPEAKVFWFFSSEKNILTSLMPCVLA